MKAFLFKFENGSIEHLIPYEKVVAVVRPHKSSGYTIKTGAYFDSCYDIAPDAKDGEAQLAKYMDWLAGKMG